MPQHKAERKEYTMSYEEYTMSYLQEYTMSYEVFNE
jgi:hypothetical protein